jgi:hypothetical protein
MNKYEKLIEYIINDEETKAKALFHEIVVEKSREIYENIMDEENFDETVGGNQVDDLADDVAADEEGMQEADEEMDDMGGDDMGDMDSMGGDDMGGDDMGDMDSMGGDEDAPATKGDIMDLEAALDELKAEFEALMSDVDQDGDGDHDMEDHGEEGDEEMPEMNEAKDEDDEEEDEEEEDMSEGKKKHMKSEAEKLREYVDKVSGGADSTEGGEVGKGGSVGINKQSIVAGKNDMGGTTANIVKGGTEQNPDGKQYKAPSNEYAKGHGTLKGAEKNVNQPGGNKGAQNFYNTKAGAKKGEGQTTDGSVSVSKNSILKKA